MLPSSMAVIKVSHPYLRMLLVIHGIQISTIEITGLESNYFCINGTCNFLQDIFLHIMTFITKDLLILNVNINLVLKMFRIF